MSDNYEAPTDGAFGDDVAESGTDDFETQPQELSKVAEYAAQAAKADVKQRTLRTLAQTVGGAVVTAVVGNYELGVHDWKLLALVGGQAAVSTVFSYLTAKFKPAKAK